MLSTNYTSTKDSKSKLLTHFVAIVDIIAVIVVGRIMVPSKDHNSPACMTALE